MAINRQELVVVSHHGKEQGVAGSGSHVGGGHHFSGPNILVLVPTDKHNTAKHKSRNDAYNGAQSVGEDQDHPKPPKPSDPFPEKV